MSYNNADNQTLCSINANTGCDIHINDDSISLNAPLQTFLECINEEFYLQVEGELQANDFDFENSLGYLFDMINKFNYKNNEMVSYYKPRDAFIDWFKLDHSGEHYFYKIFNKTLREYFDYYIRWDMEQLKRLCNKEFNPNNNEVVIDMFRNNYGYYDDDEHTEIVFKGQRDEGFYNTLDTFGNFLFYHSWRKNKDDETKLIMINQQKHLNLIFETNYKNEIKIHFARILSASMFIKIWTRKKLYDFKYKFARKFHFNKLYEDTNIDFRE